jgi:UDP-N-acetylglucosamine acyltransferase
VAPRIHPTAVVAPGAKLAPEVRIGPYAVIGPEVELAAEVEIGPHATLSGRTSVGERTRIFASCVIGTEPQIVGFAGEPTRLVIGRDNIIREFAAIHVGSPKGVGCTRIGDGNYLLNNVHVAHDCQIGSNCVLASYSALAGHVVVEDYAVFGAMTGVHQHVRIGESAFTGANSMISKDAPPFARVAGDRARFAGLNRVGLERRGFSEATLAALKHAFHLLFQSKLRLEQAVERVEAECRGVPEVSRLLAFLRHSERGFIR